MNFTGVALLMQQINAARLGWASAAFVGTLTVGHSAPCCWRQLNVKLKQLSSAVSRPCIFSNHRRKQALSNLTYHNYAASEALSCVWSLLRILTRSRSVFNWFYGVQSSGTRIFCNRYACYFLVFINFYSLLAVSNLSNILKCILLLPSEII